MTTHLPPELANIRMFYNVSDSSYSHAVPHTMWEDELIYMLANTEVSRKTGNQYQLTVYYSPSHHEWVVKDRIQINKTNT